MVKSMFAAVAGLRAHQTKMDVISNNIANVNTNGYKSASATFSDVFYSTTSASSSSGDIYGGTNASQVGYGSKISAIASDMSSGGQGATDDDKDCMIDGNGFFVVGTKLDSTSTGIVVSAGDGTTTVSGTIADEDALSALRYTRVGEFDFDEDGYLVDANGMCVYGFSEGDTDGTIDTTSLSPIRLPNALTDDATYEPVSYKSISIASTGVITGTDDDGVVSTIGEIAIANVPNPNALTRQSDGYYVAEANTGNITVNETGNNGTGIILTSYLEMSNVDLSKEFTEMITCQRGFQACTRIITVTDTMLEELVNLKR